MLFELKQEIGHASPEVVNLRCPFCRHQGAFHGLPSCPDVSFTFNRIETTDKGEKLILRQYCAGTRKCPNQQCRALVFVVHDHQNKVVKSYPAEMIDFDSTNLPAKFYQVSRRP